MGDHEPSIKSGAPIMAVIGSRMRQKESALARNGAMICFRIRTLNELSIVVNTTFAYNSIGVAVAGAAALFYV